MASQASAPPNGLEDIPTLSEEAFVVKSITLLVLALVETVEATSPLEGMIGAICPPKETVVKAMDPVCAPEESLMETTFISLMVPSSNNLPQLSMSAMLKDPSIGAAILEDPSMGAIV